MTATCFCCRQRQRQRLTSPTFQALLIAPTIWLNASVHESGCGA